MNWKDSGKNSRETIEKDVKTEQKDFVACRKEKGNKGRNRRGNRNLFFPFLDAIVALLHTASKLKISLKLKSRNDRRRPAET